MHTDSQMEPGEVALFAHSKCLACAEAQDNPEPNIHLAQIVDLGLSYGQVRRMCLRVQIYSLQHSEPARTLEQPFGDHHPMLEHN